MTTITDESVAGAFILTKHWKLTFSTAASMQQVGDSYAWENTRARATGHSAADLWVHTFPKVISIIVSYFKFSIELTFENSYLRFFAVPGGSSAKDMHPLVFESAPGGSRKSRIVAVGVS